MKTRLFVVLCCLVWALGCGNRDPEDVETGFGRFETVTLRICNNSNCVGGTADNEDCVDDSDCPGGQCEIFVPFNECFGGSAAPRTPCETALECGSACDAGDLLDNPCAVDSDCLVCAGGRVPVGTTCVTADDCGGSCLGGKNPNGTSSDGTFCLGPINCGGICVGGNFDGRICSSVDNSHIFCTNFGGVCNLDGVSCINEGECVQSGACVPGECLEVGEGCVNAQTALMFTGTWESCLNQDSFLKPPPTMEGEPGTTLPAEFPRTDGPPLMINVAGCNSATLDLSFTFNSLPSPGCVGVEFTSGDRPSLEQCGETVHMEIDFR